MNFLAESGKSRVAGEPLFPVPKPHGWEYDGWPQFRLYGEDVMTFMTVNLWSVLVAGIATMVLGFLWYSPVLFARPWMIAMGYDPEDKAKMDEMRKSAGKSYAFSFVASLASAFVLGKIINVASVDSAALSCWRRTSSCSSV